MDLAPEASLSGNAPHTPPYTPHRNKRPLERNDSPASARSIQPAETTSPAKRAAKRRQVQDDVKVEELTEGDAGYTTDLDVVYPEELEEVESDSDNEYESSDDDDDNDPGTGIADRLSRLGCDDSPEAEFEKKRRENRLRKRKDSRVFKRSHSQSVKGDTEATDSDAMGDHDLTASARRLRRRVGGPTEVKVLFDDAPRGSPETGGLASPAEIRERRRVGNGSESSVAEIAVGDVMDVDDSV
ncbi:hypothetical protein LTR37_010579 [Vermiconidia calcicola]|uniref:Uncharacterized protein n=1 Tax=Vermiconidia calcicola TaxID=1690605 RepID=A0ACC3N4W4_9PEZI|nr:hypothetical protein LTR37_010579 [Vermiconidia calcicola]